MFKRVAVSAMTFAILSGATVVPANAVSVTVKNDVCTFHYSQEEKQLVSDLAAEFGNEAPILYLDKDVVTVEKAKEQLAALGKGHPFREAIANLNKTLNDPSATSEDRENAKKGLRAIDKLTPLINARAAALRGCAKGRDVSEADSKVSAALSTLDGKPNDNGIAVIVSGVIIAVLGLVAVGLPFLAPMLPAPLQAMLPKL